MYTDSPDNAPCEDTDGDLCTTALCQSGCCNQKGSTNTTNCPVTNCSILYPFSSSKLRTNVVFNESEVLRTFGPQGGVLFSPVCVGGANTGLPCSSDTNCPGSTCGVNIKLWYNDEHAMILGVNKVSLKTGTGTATTNYTVSPLCSTPATGCAQTNPQVGTTVQDGDQAGTDGNTLSGTSTTCPYDLCDRPLWPALFVTDITSDASSVAGDWQSGTPQVCMGGTNAGKSCSLPADCPGGTCPTVPATETTAIPPSAVFGTWKSAARALDKTKNPPVATLTVSSDPSKNDWNLGPGSDPVPKHCSISVGTICTSNADCSPISGKSQTCSQPADEGYGAEARWSVKALIDNGTLQAGHSYRLEFMVHDGDQNKTGGDSGESCVNIRIPGTLTNNCSP